MLQTPLLLVPLENMNNLYGGEVTTQRLYLSTLSNYPTPGKVVL